MNNNDNVVDINVNNADRPLTDAQIEVHMKSWALAVQNNDYLGVIASLTAYAEELEATAEGLGAVTIPAYMEMKDMLRAAMPDARRVCYTPIKGWYDGGEHGENVGA